jgi:hypothetical protein
VGDREEEEEEAVDVIISGMVLNMHKEELKATEREVKRFFCLSTYQLPAG